MDETTIDAPVCPGCHFGCSIARYQCARGKGFYAKWQAGEEIPDRRALWKQAQKQEKDAEGNAAPPRPAFPVGMRVMHMLNIVSFALADHRETRPERLVADTIVRHDGCAALPIIKGRMKAEPDVVEQAVAQLVEQGLVEEGDDEVVGTMFALTDEGRAKAEEWRAERMAAEEAFLDALSDDEKAQLADLIGKLLKSTAHKGKMGR